MPTMTTTVTDADDDNAGHHSTTTRATYRQLKGLMSEGYRGE